MAYKVLLVAPTTDLALQADEVMQLVNILSAKLLQGARANLHGLLDILREGWDIIWFASHGGAEGIHLSDGVLNAAEITSLIRSAGIKLTVFNTCSSYEVAHTIHRELGTDFVATVKPVPDRTAYLAGVLFAQKIAAGLSFESAYEAAKPGQNATYIFLGGKGLQMTPYTPGRGDTGDISQLSDLVRRLEIIINGSTSWNVDGLVPTVKDLTRKIDTLTGEVEQLRQNQMFNRRLLIALSVVCVALVVAVSVLVVIQGGAT
jgi:hypothetical protein